MNNGRPASPLDAALAKSRRTWGDHVTIDVVDDPDATTWIVIVRDGAVRLDTVLVEKT